jgi:hypothetical protein
VIGGPGLWSRAHSRLRRLWHFVRGAVSALLAPAMVVSVPVVSLVARHRTRALRRLAPGSPAEAQRAPSAPCAPCAPCAASPSSGSTRPGRAVSSNGAHRRFDETAKTLLAKLRELGIDVHEMRHPASDSSRVPIPRAPEVDV